MKTRLSCRSVKDNERVADGTLSFEAAFFDPAHWDEIDTMANLNEAEKMFNGKHLEPAARNGGAFQSRPHQYFCERPADAGCRQ